MKLYVATHNQHKLREIAEILPEFEIVADDPAGVEETSDEFIGNAFIKVRAIASKHPGEWCMADDSGLEVAALGGAAGKGDAVVKIRRIGKRGVCRGRVERDADLVGRGGDKRLTHLTKKRAVGCNNGQKALFARAAHEFRQERMERRLAHQVKIKELYPVRQFISKQIKLLHRHGAPLPLRLGAEKAIKIAHVGYFKVATRNHCQFYVY